MPHQHTEEQLNVLLTLGSEDPPPCIILKAGPGSGKTYIISEGVKAGIPRREWSQVTALAFNKEIAAKLTRDLPFGCKVSTFNSYGLAAWESHILPKAVHVNPKKTKGILNAIADRGQWTISSEEVDDILALVSMAKNNGYAPPRSGTKSVSGAPSFVQLCYLADIRPESHYEALLAEILTRSIRASFEGDIDFDDQVYMTTLFVPSLSKPKWLFVDEAQDMNPLQLALVARIKASHTVLVGDPLQAIYAFRGAMSDSFDRIMARWPDAVVLPLNTSFRLPQAALLWLQGHNPLLTTAKQEVGHIHQFNKSTDLDTIIRTTTQNFHSKGESKAILCRNNAPLFKAALACIASGVPFAMANVQFGRGLVKDIKRVGRKGDDAHTLIPRLHELWMRGDMTPDQIDRVRDKLGAVEAVAAKCEYANDVVNAIEGLLRQPNKSDSSGHILLSTAHRAKGLEFDWVMHLDPQLIPSPYARTPEELAQEANIAYVINSRTKHTLVFCRSDQIIIPAAAPRQMRPNIRKDQPV